MKKAATLLIAFISVFIFSTNVSYARASNLIQSMQTSLKYNENPKRLEASFRLMEPINLSQEDCNIIFEYFVWNSNGNLELIYRKDKTWGGYLNSYDNYPLGERKYSSGVENAIYSNNVPATTIYTSIKTSAKIDVALVDAVKITVITADGSGEKVTIYSDGTTSAIEKIETPVVAKDADTGIRLNSTTMELPVGTVLNSNALTNGFIFEMVSSVLRNVSEFRVFEIELESGGKEIQPDGKVEISIPIPKSFNNSLLAVYRIDNDKTKTPYAVKVVTIEGIGYATFKTDHFSTYVLVEVVGQDITPRTGSATMDYIIALTFILAIGTMFYLKRKARNL